MSNKHFQNWQSKNAFSISHLPVLSQIFTLFMSNFLDECSFDRQTTKSSTLEFEETNECECEVYHYVFENIVNSGQSAGIFSCCEEILVYRGEDFFKRPTTSSY
jgi:hypothetical protein